MIDWRGWWRSEKTELQRFWGLEWSNERLVGAIVDRAEGHQWVQSQFTLEFTPECNPDRGVEAFLGQLKQQLSVGEPELPVVVVVPREVVVLRQLQLPIVPADELPDLVAFQAASKSSTPTAALVVDYVTIGDAAASQTVLAVTLDAPRVQRIRDLVAKAGRTLAGIEVSSFLLAELVARAEERAGTATVPTLIVAQSGDRVEISVIDRNQLIAAHATWLPSGEAARHVSPLTMELNRCLISLEQTHPGVDVAQVYLIEEMQADPAVGAVLRDRFGDKVHKLSIDSFCPDAPPQWRMVTASFLGRALGEEGLVSRVNLAEPRRPAAAPDNRRRNGILAGSAAVLLLGGLVWNYRSRMAEMDEVLEQASTETAGIIKDLEDGKADLAAAKTLDDWSSGRQDMLTQLDALQQQFPGTSSVYVINLKMIPASGSILKVIAEARARERADLIDLGQQMTDSGWSVKPLVPKEQSKDPDYPWGVVLEAEWSPPPEPDKPSPPPTAAVSAVTSPLTR